MMTMTVRGVVKAVWCVIPDKLNRTTEDVVTFDAHCFLHLYLHEMPFSQCVQWVEVAKMNQLRREGIRYPRVLLYDYDIYFLQRNITHQFRVVTVIIRHLRLKHYYPDRDPDQEIVENIANEYEVE
ncbi:hypothetical protein pipiens_003485 [Culex pipiens pipiens]|uniref:Uncharacterized protein n=1 Tax=Culex pipiens pipiens TaxID=38569 RepID=A0ABD1CZP0_CULPP